MLRMTTIFQVMYDTTLNRTTYIERAYVVESVKQRTYEAMSTQLLTDRTEVRMETKCALAMLGYTMRCRVRGLIPFMDKFAHLIRSLPPVQKDWERRNFLNKVFLKKYL